MRWQPLFDSMHIYSVHENRKYTVYPKRDSYTFRLVVFERDKKPTYIKKIFKSQKEAILFADGLVDIPVEEMPQMNKV